MTACTFFRYEWLVTPASEDGLTKQATKDTKVSPEVELPPRDAHLSVPYFTQVFLKTPLPQTESENCTFRLYSWKLKCASAETS